MEDLFNRILLELQGLKDGQTTINGRLDKIDQRLDRIDQRLDRVEQRLDRVEQRLDKVETDIKILKRDTKEIRLNIQYLWDDVKKLDTRLTVQENKIRTAL